MTQITPPRGHPHLEMSILQKLRLNKGHKSYDNKQILI